MYLTPDDYEIARKNGISKRTAYDRFYYRKWSKERAITEPVRKVKVSHDPWRKVAVSNGINPKTYDTRIRDGWEPELAATTPSGTYVGRYARKQSLVEN